MIKLALLRHGESVWNKLHEFTGWTDIKLTPKGIQEAKDAGKILKEKGFVFDVVFTSFLKRAIDTTNLALEELQQSPLIIKSWRLNERHYGALQGHTHEEMEEKEGKEQVMKWRRSFDVRPPELSKEDKRNPRKDALYCQVDPALLPLAESLKDCLERVIPFYDEMIVPALEDGKTVLISAHGNSLRALRKHLENISDEEIPHLEIPTGKPYIYELDETLSISNKYYLEK